MGIEKCPGCSALVRVYSGDRPIEHDEGCKVAPCKDCGVPGGSHKSDCPEVAWIEESRQKVIKKIEEMRRQHARSLGLYG